MRLLSLCLVLLLSTFAFAQPDDRPTVAGLTAIAAQHGEPSTGPEVKLNGVTQFRYVLNSKNGPDSYGFDVPLTRIDVSGDLNKDVSFRISPRIDSDGNFVLEDAFAKIKMGSFNLKAGQFRPQFAWEFNHEDEENLTMSHSIVGTTLAQDFTQGIELQFSNPTNPFRLSASLTEGFDHSNTSYVQETNFGFGGRAEYSLNKNLGFGAGVYVLENITSYTADVQFGFNKMMGDVEVLYSDNNTANMLGVVGELAYNCSDKWQPFIKHQIGNAEHEDTFNVTSVGVNYYLVGKAVRWTTEFGYAWNELPSTWDYTNTGFASSSDTQYMFGTMLQISF